ncbi:arsenite efflux transporter metallochaperone ArsD [Conexibacter sp. DBS9H8]|uniref:arsenite efflux transporter metallochaperone ArsD n=1 Tax=Conexibacter sp. DBS9H8 TaxID=2937801 RepID=UPI00200D2E57|nr:arsenite efflux transporter metallochaperone ArsD [Conexibacter sp. DBS9H8]
MSSLTHPASESNPSAPAGHALELFEPAMCCETGVCGPAVDQSLITLREDLRWAGENGATVARHNLATDPDAFVASPKVTGLIAAFGERALPALVLDGEIVLHGRYPSRDELAGFLSAPVEADPAASGGGCGSSGCC